MYKTKYLGLTSQYDLMLDLKIKVGHCDLFSWVSDFALYLEDYLIHKINIWGL